MRFLAAVGVIAASLALAHAADGFGAHAPVAPGASWIKQLGPGKPGAAPSGAAPARGNDTCRWAHDNECDEPDIGTGACAMGTDFSDCRHIRAGDNDTCRWARDGECDEPGFGTGACTQGTDRTDCGNIAWLRNQRDSCATAFNGVCDEPGRGAGSCERNTDRSDCLGRNRPMTINDHFFGHDDRVLVNVNEAPWRFMGQLHMDSGSNCSATLIAPNVLATAAHCIHSRGALNASGRFVAAGGEEARITGYLIDPRFNYQRFTSSDDIDGLDWALLRIDRPLGDQLGHAGVYNLTGQGRQRALGTDLMQAGYSWDTGNHLSGNLRCRIITLHPDNTYEHECDTTRGDSGSGFLIRNGQGFDLIGVDSSFRSNPNGPFIYIAVSAAAFASRVPDFAAGRTGVRVGAAAGPGAKPAGPRPVVRR